MLKEAKQREEAEAERERQRKRERRQRREAAAAEAASLDNAKRELEQAIAAVRRATRDRSGVAEAEAAWRAAKARVLELETGTAPDWAPAPEPEEPLTDESTEQAADEPSSAGDAEASDTNADGADDAVAESASTDA